MIQIQQVKLPITHTEEDLKNRLAHMLRITPEHILSYKIAKKSIDARKKEELQFVYTIHLNLKNESKIAKKINNKNVMLSKKAKYKFPTLGTQKLTEKPVIIGSGPAGLFCALFLARHGYCPIVLERGGAVEERVKLVEKFWETGILDADCNVQFGEGGAGTFSDGKLNTLVKDKNNRNKKILETFVEAGASEEILYLNKPHIGTDKLREIVARIREEIISLGGEIRFHAAVTDLQIEKGQIQGVTINGTEQIKTHVLIPAIGHSARDTFSMFYEKGLSMLQKSFAIGVRIEHPQSLISEAQYGKEGAALLPAADYKLTHQTESGRGVYSFCMCPGGFVVNASSEEHKLAVNGMSYHKRDGVNANSAIVVTVTPKDFKNAHPLAGIEYQRALEGLAYTAGNGKVPVQTFGDFVQNVKTMQLGEIEPQIKGAYELSNVRPIFSESISTSIEKGICAFEHQIKGFSRKDAILSGVESRTSSPVRILRDENLESSIKGIYPCGEGAGYAGGITSAAMDGLKVAEKIASVFAPVISS